MEGRCVGGRKGGGRDASRGVERMLVLDVRQNDQPIGVRAVPVGKGFPKGGSSGLGA